MRVTFFLLRRGYVRNFASTIEGLLAHGHDVHLGFDMPEHSPTGIEERLAQRYPRLTWDEAPKRDDRWIALFFAIRGMIDVIRYYHPDYRDAPALRQRVQKKGRRHIGNLGGLLDRLFATRSAWMVRKAVGVLNWIQFKLPASRQHLDYLKAKKPDVVMVTPLVNLGSPEVDHIEAANELGIPAVVPVASWDNLTNKGLLRCRPDRVLVWNAPQKQEAGRYHYLAPEKVRVTGAHTFDRWLGREPVVSREAFLEKVGLDPSKPHIAFMCSSSFIARQEEVTFVRNWIAAIRASDDAAVCDIGVLVRPHFQNADQWKDADLSDLGNAAIYPRGGANPVNPGAEEDFFDTLYYARAVIGVNTTAMIEAGLLGRPVMSLETDQFATTQSGSLHFRHLRKGGLLKYATGMDEHLRQLGETLRNPPSSDANEAFLDYFVRCPEPGLSATSAMVREIEAAAALEKKPVRRGASDWLVRVALIPVADTLTRVKAARHRRRLIKEGLLSESEAAEAEPPSLARRLRKRKRAVVKRVARQFGGRQAADN